MISCQVIEDLLPLVQDGVASAESAALVQEHCAHCSACRALWERTPPPALPESQPGAQRNGKPGAQPGACPEDPAGAALAERRLLRRLRQRLCLPLLGLLALGVCLGVGLSGTAGQFYNLLLMPLAGGLGYGLLGRRGWPVLPAAVWGLTGLSCLLPPFHPLGSLLLYGGLYALLALLGELAAGLLHYACKGECKR